VIDALCRLDAAKWDTGLSPANARACWAGALSTLGAEGRPRVDRGRAPRAVGLIASANVFTAPLEWLVQLAARGVPTLLKPARGQTGMAEAWAGCIPGMSVRPWRGGELDPEAEFLAEVDGVIAFGRRETLDAIGARVPPGVVYIPFGPRYGVSVVDEIGADTVLDHALYDGRGCMSPAAVFARRVNLADIGNRMEAAETQLPRGRVEPADAAAIRARVALGKAVGRVEEGAHWAVIELPIRYFSPIALPRVLNVHPFADLEEVRAAVEPTGALLGTVAGEGLDATRVCAPGRMQFPEVGRAHDGVDVLAALWRR